MALMPQPLDQLIEYLDGHYETVQSEIATRAQEGSLTLENARVGKLLSQTGTAQIFQTLRESGIKTLDVQEFDTSDSVAQMGATLSAGVTALRINNLQLGKSEYRSELDRTGISNSDFEVAIASGAEPSHQILSTALSSDTDCKLENDVDKLAREISETIKLKPDWNEREYGAVIYETADGTIKHSALSSGETVAEAQARANAAGDSSFAPRTGMTIPRDAVKIHAVVHNHPDVGYDDAGDASNMNPSDSDWGTFDILTTGVDGGGGATRWGQIADPSKLALYVVGPNGDINEFHEADRLDHNGDAVNFKAPDNTHDVDHDACAL